MSCQSCGHENPAANRFCGGCGVALARACPACAHGNPPDHRFCGACGASLEQVRSSEAPGQRARPADQADARKVVTIIFADLIGSTSLHERLDAESTRRLMDRYYRVLHAAVETHGGTVVKLMGDGVMAAFGVPRVAEDDAIRAVHAGVAMQDAFHELARTELAAVGDIGLRVGINTGEVVVSADNTDVVGDPVNVAARLQQEAHDGEVVIGEPTRRLVAALVTLAPLGSVALKGRSEAMKAYRVESLDRPVGTTTAAFVGRDDEIGRIARVYEAATAAPGTRLAVLLGSPGLGKSRTIEEFTRRLGDTATVLTAQCDAAGGATFAPLAAALRELLLQTAQATPTSAQGVALGSSLPALSGLSPEHAGDDLQPQRGDQPIARGNAPGDAGAAEDLRAAIAAVVPGADAERTRIVSGIAALLAGSPASPEETFFVVRRLLAGIASVKPVVLVIDDLHWAEPLLLDLVEHLVQWGSGVPLLVLVGARPELRDTRSALATSGGFVADVVTLSGLDAGAATRLAANVIGAADLPAAVAAKVLATSEGNPLFVAELVRMLVQEGALTRQGDRWTAGVGLAAFEMPPTIHALLAARIERLRPEDRGVLERAAVVGRHFSRSAVAALLPREVTDLDARLEALRRAEIIEPDSGWFLGEPVLRFHHVLIRDAAYRRLLKGTRAELHERVANWIELRAPEAAEHDETLGWHLEQAHQFLGELGPIDASGRALGERAARHLAAAGRRALARDDLPVAGGLLGRALDRLDVGDPSRAELALDWCEALLAAGDVGTAAKAIDELGRFIDAPIPAPSPGNEFPGSVDQSRLKPTARIPAESPSGDFSATQPGNSFPGVGTGASRLRAWHTCFTGQLTALTAPQSLHATADAVAAAAAELAALGDTAGEAKAHFVHAQAFARLGKIGACEAALDRALAAARRAGDRRRANTVLAVAPLAALWGPSPVTRASGRCLDVVRVLRITQGAPAVEAVALSCQGVLEALRGRTDAARRMIASARKMVEELGITQRLLEADVFAGRIELLEGDAIAAERCLRGAYDGLRNLGLGIDAARAAALLGRALLEQDRAAEAESLSRECEALAGDDLQASIAWRGVRAEALARRGEHTAAVELAKAAVEIAAATDALLDHANARLALAAALRAAGRSADADAEERRAIELWEAKGATLLAERARRDGEGLEPHVRPSAARTASARPVRRRVRPNAATADTVRLDAAVAARDEGALLACFADDLQVVDHTTGAVFDRQAGVTSYRGLMNARDPVCRHEPLATLGDSLALFRLLVSASGLRRGRLDIGAYDKEEIHLVEVGAQGWRRRGEVFSPDHLGDAIARLYQRYAELLPEGPERRRAAVTARAIAYTLTDSTTSGTSLLFDPRYEDIDHRNVGYGKLSPDEAQKLVVTQRALADGLRFRIEDILALRPDALVRKTTTSGVWRDGGGAFERTVCMLSLFGADGRATRQETFDSDREAEALARFDELTPEPAPAPPVRRVRQNEVTAFWARFDAMFAARDADAIDGSFSNAFAEIDHTTGASYGRDGALRSIRKLLRSPDPGFRHEPLATLGPSLGLVRGLISASGTGGDRFDVGAYEIEEIKVAEVDEQRQLRSAEVFARERLGNAIARLYERYAELLPDGPERVRATARARAAALLGEATPDPDQTALMLAPDAEYIDHNQLGYPAIRGADAMLRHYRTLFELTTDVRRSVIDIVALTPGALLVRRLTSGTLRASGGVFENRFLSLEVAGPDGLITHIEEFNADGVTAALARLDELTGNSEGPNPLAPFPAREGGSNALPSVPAPGRDRGRGSWAPFTNAATRFCDRIVRAWAARDWDAVTALHSAAHHNDDRRRLMQMRVAAEANLTQLRLLFDVPRSRMAVTPVATRGERLALSRILYEGDSDGGGGSLAIDYLGVIESDGDGRLVEIVLFDLDNRDAAYAELDARYEAGEGAAHPAHGAFLRAFAQAIASRDWEPVLARCAPGFTEYDHRALAVLGTTRSAEGWVQNFRTLTDLAPDTVYRVDHFRSAAHGFWSVGTWHGSREGGDYEIPINAVLEMDRDRLARADIYDPEQLDQAGARFEELNPSVSPLGKGRIEEGSLPAPFANAATRAVDRGTAALAARDWEGFTGLFATGFRHYDRTRIAQIETDGREWLASFRWMVEMTTGRPTQQVLATRGERLALFRVIWRGAEGDIGPSEIDWALIIEVDSHGGHVAVVAFDPDDLAAAYTELDARWEAGEAAQHPHVFVWVREFQRAFAARDWQAMAALHAPDQVAVNHRTVGWGTLRGPGAWVPTLQALVELAPDTCFRLDHLRTCERGILWQSAWLGTRDGGPFETPQLVATELDDHGRQIRMDVWDADVFEPARARFAEMTTAPVERAQRFANAATATTDPVIARLVAHDWQGFEQLFAEGFHMSDRRRLVQLDLDRDQYVAFTRGVSDGRTIRGHSEVMATRGDRLALTRSTFEFTDADVGPSEITFLILTEVDHRGRITTYVRWDLDDLDAAYAEIEARWEAGEAAAHPLASRWIADYQRFFAARDWNAMAAIMAPDLVSQNHRLVSWGTLHGPQGLVSTMQAQMELAPDTELRADHIRTCAGGVLMEYAWYGTREGGAFENLLIAAVELDARGRGRRIDVWEAAQLEQARARFDAIGASRVVNSPPGPLSWEEREKSDPLRVPPNASTRANDRWWACVEAGDWDAVRALVAPIVFEDRRRLIRIAGGADLLLADSRHLWEAGWRPTRTLLATAGDRLSLERMLWSVSDEGQRSEIDVLKVCEVDHEGLIVAYLIFDADDRAAASAELVQRYALSGAGEIPATWFEFWRAWNAHDLGRLRTLLPTDYYFHDHRHTGIGQVVGEAYVVSLAALYELSPDVRLEPLYWVAAAAHGGVGVMRWVGTNAEGGEFEAVFVGLSLYRGERPVGAELFEIADLDAALARFEELRPDSL